MCWDLNGNALYHRRINVDRFLILELVINKMFTVIHKNILVLSSLLILLTIEAVFPYFGGWTSKVKHISQNAAIVIFNAVIINFLFVPLIVLSTNTPFGLFNQIKVSYALEIFLSILILDFVSYFMHVLYHKVPLMWRFHKMHHSDTAMDVTTAARFHIGEHVISLSVRALVYAIFAMKLEFILISESIFLVNVLLQHSNITLTEPIDRIYRIFFTSPNMHKVHHSNKEAETDSNYTSVFSFWDRLFRTYTIVKNPKKIIYGVKGLEKEQSFISMLMTPFKK